jgi:hypothetical protein
LVSRTSRLGIHPALLTVEAFRNAGSRGCFWEYMTVLPSEKLLAQEIEKARKELKKAPGRLKR